MVVKNKLAWSSIEAVNRDFGSCLYDLQNFKMLYTKEDMPALWERYIKEGFKNYMVSFLELTKAMLYYKTIDLNIRIFMIIFWLVSIIIYCLKILQ